AATLAGTILEAPCRHEQRLRVRHPVTSARLSAVRSHSLSTLRDPHGVRDLLPVLRAHTAGRPRRAIDRAVRRELATPRRGPAPATRIEARGGFAEARRALGVWGPLRGPTPATMIEARAGFPGARRAWGVWGPLRGPTPATMIEARAGFPGARRAWGVWGPF